MNRLSRILLVGLLAVIPRTATAQQDLEVIEIPPAGKVLRWYGHLGRTYFIQASDNLDTASSWNWSNMIESGNDEYISHETGSISGRAFFRLHYTDDPVPAGVTLDDWDADGDGLSNIAEVNVYFTDPLKADTSGDGIPDGWAVYFGLDPLANNSDEAFQGGPETSLDAFEAGVKTLPGASVADLDGDGSINDEDADNDDADVIWPPAAEGNYLLIDIDPMLASGVGLDLNDKAEVLFGNGVSTGNTWTPYEAAPILGTYTNPQSQTMDFEVELEEWRNFNNDRELVGTATLDFTSGPGTDDGFTSAIGWSNGQSPINLGSFLPSASYSSPSLRSMGIDETGRTFARLEFTEQPTTGVYQAAARIAIFAPNGNLTSLLEAPSGYRPTGGAGHFDVSQSGWVTSNAKSQPAGSPAIYQLAAWDAATNQLSLPPEADGFFYPVHLTDLPSGISVLNATYTPQGQSHVFLPNGSGQMKRAGKLSNNRIRIWAGDGTALTADEKVWVNGQLVPLEELCPDIETWQSPGQFIHPQAANSRGDFLLLVGDDLQTVVDTKVLLKTDLQVAVGSKILPENEEDTDGAWAVVNWDDDDNDAGAWGHGQTNLTSDLDDNDGVDGEDDLLHLGIKRVSIAGSQYRLKFNSEHIRIWRTNEKDGPDPEITSEDSVITIAENLEWKSVHIEGIKPHDDDDGTIVELEVKVPGGQWVTGDSAKIRVARPIAIFFGDGANTWSTGYAATIEFFNQRAGKNPTRIRGEEIKNTPATGNTPAKSYTTWRTPTYLMEGKSQEGEDVCYSAVMYRGNGNPAFPSSAEKFIKLALLTEDMNLSLVGHCNYGVGMSLGDNFNDFSQFFNMAGGGTASISMTGFGGSGHPPMHIFNEALLTYVPGPIADRNSKALVNPVNRIIPALGSMPTVSRFPHDGTPLAQQPANTWATQEDPWTRLDPPSSGVIKWHYIAHDDQLGNGANDKHTIVNSGASDLPANPKFRCLYLDHCNTYRCFIESFNQGVVIATHTSIPNGTSPLFCEALVEGWSWPKVDEEMDLELNNKNDPSLPLRGAFEIVEFE